MARFMADFYVDRPDAVSYTHLDVYKRQVHELLIEQVTIVVKSNKVKLPIYVDKALKAINKVMLD